MMENNGKTAVVDDYTIDDLLAEANVDLENVEAELSASGEDLEDALQDASKKLKKSLEKLVKQVKKEVKSDLLNYYHDNKKVINSDVKALNSFVKEILQAIKEELSEEIDDSVDKDERKALKEVRSEVRRFSRKYNHKYAMLKLKLALGNAEVDVKNLFS